MGVLWDGRVVGMGDEYVAAAAEGVGALSVGIEVWYEVIEVRGIAGCGAGVEEGVVIGFGGLRLMSESGVIGDGIESLCEEPVGVGFDGGAICGADGAEVEDGDFIFGFGEAAVPEVIGGVVLFAPDFLDDVDAIDGRVAAVFEDVADMSCSEIVTDVVVDSVDGVKRLEWAPWFANFVIVAVGVFTDDVGAIVVGLPAAEHIPDDEVAEDVADGRHFEGMSDDAAGECKEPCEDEGTGSKFFEFHGSPSFRGGACLLGGGWGAAGC